MIQKYPIYSVILRICDSQVNEIQRYIAELDRIYWQGNDMEHSYRPSLKTLFETLVSAITSGLTITNEPKRIACGAPDYIITRNDIPIGYIEAKDIPVGIYNSVLWGFDRTLPVSRRLSSQSAKK